MDPSNIPINSISIDIPACAAEDQKNDKLDCNHDFTIRGYVLANREKNELAKHWPFSEKHRNSFEEHGYDLPPMSRPPRCRWHACKTCLRDINSKDFQFQNVISMPVILGQKLDKEPPVIPSTSAVISNDEEKAATAAGDDVGEEIKEDVECEGSQKSDQQKGAKRGQSVGPTTRRYNFRNNRRRVESTVNKKPQGRLIKSSSTRKEKAVVDEVVDTALDLAPQVEETPSRSDGLDRVSSEDGRNKTRSLNELLKKNGTARKKQPSRKRKDADQDDAVVIKGKKKNKRFQIDEEAVQEKEAPVVSLGNGKDEKKLEVAKNKQPVPVAAESAMLRTLIQAMNQEIQAQTEENQGYVRKSKPKDKPSVFRRPSLPGIRIGDGPSSTKVAVQQKDVSVADRKGKKIMVQDDETPRSKGFDRRQNAFEEQDDTVMEIVELMAKNQYERSLPDKEEDVSKKQPAQEAAPRSNKALMIDLNEEAYDDEAMSLEDIDTPEPVTVAAPAPSPAPASSPSVATYGRREQHIIIEIQQRARNIVPSRPTTLPSSYRNFPPPVQNIRGQWLGNVPHQHPSPSPYPVLQGCQTCHQPQYREIVQPLWPNSMMTPHVHHQRPVYYNVESANPSILPQASSSVSLPASFGTRLLAPEIAMNSLFNTPVLGVPSPLGYQNGQAPWSQQQQSTAMRNNMFPVYNRPETMVFSTGSNERLQPQQRRVIRNEVPVYNVEDSVVFAPRNQHQTVYNRHGSTTLASSSGHQHQPSPTTVHNRHGSTTLASSSGHQHQPSPTTVHINRHGSTTLASSSGHQHQPSPTTVHINRHGNTTLASSSGNQHQPSPNVNIRHDNTTVASSSRSRERNAETSNNASALPSGSRSEPPPMQCIINRNPADFTVPEAGNEYMINGDDLKINKRARRSR